MTDRHLYLLLRHPVTGRLHPVTVRWRRAALQAVLALPVHAEYFLFRPGSVVKFIQRCDEASVFTSRLKVRVSEPFRQEWNTESKQNSVTLTDGSDGPSRLLKPSV